MAPVLFLILLTATISAGEKGKTEVKLDQWLVAGPVNTPLPVYHKDSFKLKDLLNYNMLTVAELSPTAGKSINWLDGNSLAWETAEMSKKAVRLGSRAKIELPQVAYLATWIETGRFVKAELRINSHHLLKVYLNGNAVADKPTSEKDDPKDVKHKLELENGKHLLVIKALRDPGLSKTWKIEADLTIQEPFSDKDLVVNVTPKRVMDVNTLLNGTRFSSASISPDGSLAIVRLTDTNAEGHSESWLELHNLENGKQEQTWRGGMQPGSVSWAPKGRQFAFTRTSEKKSTLWLVDIDKGTTTALMKDIESLGSFSWAADGKTIVYSINKPSEADKRGVKRLRSPRDRWPWFRDKSFLYRLDIKSGIRQRLTAGSLGTPLAAISPNGDHIAFTHTEDDFDKRPYTLTRLQVMDLQTFEADTLMEAGWLGGISWSPDGKQLMMSGSPALFGDIGTNVSEGRVPNDYDAQLYLYDLNTKKPTALTRKFDPAVGRAAWHGSGKAIYFSATDGEFDRLYRYHTISGDIEKLPLKVETLRDFSLARDGARLIYWGSGPGQPMQAYTLDLKSFKSNLLAAPARQEFADVQFGKVKAWSFENQDGTTIAGTVYYPPNFDENKSWPCIVYYYGGTVSVTRDFGGRYPKDLFAALGYVVYVPQPSGATGYGQEFSSLHVNNWGKTVAGEIIDGTKQFLEAHPFVDAKRVGCIGASYGGFMTMYLMTATDMFATGISHAGISALSSYWGIGYWGYLYSSVASAESFPWNRRDIYVDQSPLFNADKVKNPILLLHGDSDTNVPPGESDQFYTALKLLGKEVEYVQIAGQDHHILDYQKRKIWQKTILAWFDKHLKGQPEWWNSLYKDTGE